MLMMIFQRRQLCPHFIVRETETQMAKPSVQDPTVLRKESSHRLPLVWDDFSRIHLLGSHLLYIDKIALLL